MKYLFTSYLTLLFLGLCLFASCDQSTENTTEIPFITQLKPDSIRSITNSQPTEKINYKRLNFTDKNGLKQGNWEEVGWRNAIVGLMHYVNDTLDGPWWSSHGITIGGNYKKGKKEGYERYYYQNEADSNTVSLGYYENDTPQWFAHPMSDQGLILLAKNMNVQLDSVYMRAPFLDGTLWYEGLYLLKEPVGVHQFYYPNGQLQGKLDHASATFIEYDSSGVLLRSGSLEDLTFIKRFGVGSDYNE